ncbi:MAG: uroporphyrinogen decarboxylase family protein [bacterium]
MPRKMTGKERILKALDRGEPDRVPVFEMALNEASIVGVGKHFTENVPPVRHLSDMTLEEQLRYMDLLSLILKALGNDGISTVLIFRKERAGDKLVRDKFGTVYRLSEVGEPIPVGGPVREAADIRKLLPMEPDPLDFAMLQYLIHTMGKDVAHFFTLPGPFRFSWQLRGGMEKLLLDYMRNPGLVLELARITTDFCLAAIEMAAGAGANVVVLEGDLAFNTNTLMNPDQYRRFVKPFHEEIVRFCHGKGLRAVKHSDGNLWPILEDLVEVGFDGIHPIQPQCMDIGQVKDRLQGRAAVIGNIDCSFLLPFGSVDEVEAAVKETIRAAAPGGGYIISSSNSIHPGVKPENYVAMVRAARKYGAYPIGF